MKYKIERFDESKIVITTDSIGKKIISVKEKVWYQAARKGKILGFWHSIGHEWMSMGLDNYIIPYKADTLEEIEDYIYKWHKVNSNDSNIEIINKDKFK